MPSAMAGEDAHGRTPAVPGLTVLVVDDEAPALSEMQYLLCLLYTSPSPRD